MKKAFGYPLLTMSAVLSLLLAAPALAQQHQHGTQENKSTSQQSDKKADDSKPGQMKCCMQEGQMGKGMMGGGMRQGMGPGRPDDMQTIHSLFENNTKITRNVRNIDNGIEAVTESDDAKVRALIVEHAYAMKKRLESGQPIRQWDPLFAALFQNADKIKLEIFQTEKGVRIVETSNDQYVVKLIQSHAGGVSEFVREGMPSMHKRHELPGAPAAETAGFLGKGDGIATCPVTGEPVNKQVKAELMGRTVYFCCESCRDTVVKNPEKFLKPLK